MEITCPKCKQIRTVNFGKPNSLCRSCARKQANIKTRICKFCGKEFKPASNFQQYCKGPHIRICPICHKEYVENNVENLKRPPIACSYACRAKKTRQTSLNKYNCKAPGNNTKAREKAKSTMLERYGVEYAMESTEIRNKARQSLINKYEVDNISKSKQAIEKRIKTNMKKYGVAGAFLLPEYSAQRISKTNLRFEKLLTENDMLCEKELQVETKYFDFHILNTNTLIEINPSYTHSTQPTHYGSYRDKYYHRDKTELAERNGYRCIHVFDWDDWDKIIDLVKPTESIYARNCEIYILNLDISDRFIKENHLQRNCRGTKIAFGLVYNDELYQVMSFGLPRYNKKYSAELLRLCTKSGYRVVGGASKLFKFATENYGLTNIISYCDRSKFSGNVYYEMGMKLSHKTPPQEIWSRENKKITSNLLRARGYDQLFGTSYGKDTSNELLMLENGWLPVYGCGQLVFSFT